MTRSTFFGAIAAFRLLRSCGSLGSRTTSAPNAFSLADFSALRDNATTVRPIDWPSNTDATPTPPDAPVTSSTERSGGGAGGSSHWVSACQAVRKTKGAPAISSADHPGGMGTRLSSGTSTCSASVPQTSAPTLQVKIPMESPTRTLFTLGWTSRTTPDASRPRMWGSEGLAGYCA